MKKLLLAFAVMLALSGCVHKPIATEWEHGFKTNDITATRYANSMIGYSIGLTYSDRYDYKADRTEVFDFIDSQGCWVYQGGGMPHGEYFMRCKNIDSKEQANKFLIN